MKKLRDNVDEEDSKEYIFPIDNLGELIEKLINKKNYDCFK